MSSPTNSNFLDIIRYNPPYVVSIEVTYRCPMGCLYCHNPPDLPPARSSGGIRSISCNMPVSRTYSRRYSRELGTYEWLKIIYKISQLRPYNFVISGGEPLLRKDIYIMIIEASNLNLKPLLLTSGSIYSKEIAQKLKEAGLNRIRINVSSHVMLDIANPDRLKRTIYERIKAIEIYKEAGFYVQVGILYIRPYIDMIEDIVERCLEAGADLVEIHHMARYGHGFYNYYLLKPIQSDVEKLESLREKLVTKYGEKIYFAVDKDIVIGRKPYPNLWGLIGLAIVPDGSIFPSEEASAMGDVAILGNALVDDIREVWMNNALLNRLRSLEWLCEPCRSCSIKMECRGGSRFIAYMLTGNLFSPDPTCPLAANQPDLQEKELDRATWQLRIRGDEHRLKVGESISKAPQDRKGYSSA
ncbi:MAG: radical SAM protein [Sulfolobales archaeon]